MYEKNSGERLLLQGARSPRFLSLNTEGGNKIPLPNMLKRRGCKVVGGISFLKKIGEAYNTATFKKTKLSERSVTYYYITLF